MNTTWLDAVFLLIMVALFAYDFIRVYRGEQSISIMTWIAEQIHPTLIVGIMLVGIYLAYCTWGDFPVAFSITGMTFHLCTSEGAYAALTTGGRWSASASRAKLANWLRPMD
jgi:hypothetical protein